MPEYIIAYHGGREPETKEEGQRGRERWLEWISGLGEAVINPGTPLVGSKLVTKEGVSDMDETRLTGYTIITADSFDEALAAAKGCPFLEMGTIEVAELKKM